MLSERKIVSAPSQSEFDHRVNGLLAEGWQTTPGTMHSYIARTTVIPAAYMPWMINEMPGGSRESFFAVEVFRTPEAKAAYEKEVAKLQHAGHVRTYAKAPLDNVPKPIAKKLRNAGFMTIGEVINNPRGRVENDARLTPTEAGTLLAYLKGLHLRYADEV